MSRLLQLPPELRDKIYKLVLGTRMIHLISEELPSFPFPGTILQDASSSNLGENETVYSDDLYYRRCVENSTEQEAYEISQDLDLNDPYGIMPGVLEGRCRYCRRHSLCARAWYSVPWRGSPKHGGTVHSKKSNRRLALLRVARTVYHETSAILYANTIFSFKLAHTLTTFPQNLTPLQQSTVRNVHLDINLDADHHTWSWKSDNLRRTLMSLPCLRELHLTIRQSCQGDNKIFLKTVKDESLPLWTNDLVHFRHSSLQNITVVIEDIDSTMLQEWNGTRLWQGRRDYLEREGHWKMAERAQYARMLRDKLLAI